MTESEIILQSLTDELKLDYSFIEFSITSFGIDGDSKIHWSGNGCYASIMVEHVNVGWIRIVDEFITIKIWDKDGNTDYSNYNMAYDLNNPNSIKLVLAYFRRIVNKLLKESVYWKWLRNGHPLTKCVSYDSTGTCV